MSVVDARIAVKGMEAAFAAALAESVPILAAGLHVLEHGTNGDVDPERIAVMCRNLADAIGSLRDMAMTWHAACAVMAEVEG